jgi:hypothetical protein
MKICVKILWVEILAIKEPIPKKKLKFQVFMFS